jgi:hypothetical protein
MRLIFYDNQFIEIYYSNFFQYYLIKAKKIFKNENKKISTKKRLTLNNKQYSIKNNSTEFERLKNNTGVFYFLNCINNLKKYLSNFNYISKINFVIDIIYRPIKNNIKDVTKYCEVR